MKLFFDTEFTGLHKNTTLMSIGIVDEVGNTFYAELTDYDESQVNDWIKQNVIANFTLTNEVSAVMRHSDGITDETIRGTKEEVSNHLINWLSRYYVCEFVSDVCHYDGVLLIDLLSNGKTAMDIPNHISPAIYDINQDIAAYNKVTTTVAFNLNREVIAYGKRDNESKHNALHDACVIKDIYYKINKK